MTQSNQTARHRTRLHMRPLPAGPERRATVLAANIGQLLDALRTVHRDCLDLRDATTALSVSLRTASLPRLGGETDLDELLVGLHGAATRFHHELDHWHSALQRQVDGLHMQADKVAPDARTGIPSGDDGGAASSAG